MLSTAAMHLAQQSSGRLIVAVLLLIGVTIAGGMVILAVRRHTMAGRRDSSFETLSLSEIRDLHARGELSDEEYEALRAAALGAFGYAPRPEGDERRAPPGLDLTGEPLPDFRPGDEPGAGPTHPPPK